MRIPRIPAAALPFIVLGFGVSGGLVHSLTTPEPTTACAAVTYEDGQADWYCGDARRVPLGGRMKATQLQPCTSDDGTGPIPCHYDARARGNRKGTSFTVLPQGDPLPNGTQRVLIHYADGRAVTATVPVRDVDCWDDASCAATRQGYVVRDPQVRP